MLDRLVARVPNGMRVEVGRPEGNDLVVAGFVVASNWIVTPTREALLRAAGDVWIVPVRPNPPGRRTTKIRLVKSTRFSLSMYCLVNTGPAGLWRSFCE